MSSRTSSRKRKTSVKAKENEEFEEEIANEGLRDDIYDNEESVNIISPLPTSARKKQKPVTPKVVVDTIKYFRYFGVNYESLRKNDKLPSLTSTPSESSKSSNLWRWKNLGSFFYKFLLQMISSFDEPTKIFLLRYFKTCIETSIGEQAPSQNKERFYNKLIENIALAFKASPFNSAQKRALRAVIVNALSVAELSIVEKKYDVKIGSTGSSRINASRDFEDMMNEKLLEKKKQHRRKISLDTIRNVVRSQLSWDNCQHVYWKSRKIVLSETEIYEHFPKLMRKISMSTQWDEYQKATRHLPKESKVGRSTYIKIMGAITYHDPVVIQAVDYVTGELVTDTIELMQDVLEKMVKHGDSYNNLEVMLTLCRHFLKNQFKLHATKDNDNECFHGLDYGLNAKAKDTIPRTSTCPACKFPFYVVDSLILKVKKNKLNRDQEMVDNAVVALEDGKQKFLQYMKHVMRVRAQQVQIENIYKEMEQECIATDGIIIRLHMIIDFKMKWNPSAARELTKWHFGKRGISWHGILFVYYKMINELQPDGSYKRVPKKVEVYLDQILSKGSKQDVYTVLSLLEIALMSIVVHFPHIRKVSMQSDNATSYQNNFLIFGISYLNYIFKKYGLKIFEYLHTETQDGKSLLDAHFAKAARFLRNFLKNFRHNKFAKIFTGADLAEALSSGRGMVNSIVQKIQLNQDKLDEFKEAAEPILGQVSEYFSRVNHIYFDDDTELHPSCDESTSDPIEIFRNMKGSISVQAHSGIGRKVKFFYDMKENTFDCDEVGKKEMEEFLRDYGVEENVSRNRNDDTDENTTGIITDNPNQYLTMRIAKFFEDFLYFGTVHKYDPRTRWWRIIYDDNDREDFSFDQLAEALALYEEEKLHCKGVFLL